MRLLQLRLQKRSPDGFKISVTQLELLQVFFENDAHFSGNFNYLGKWIYKWVGINFFKYLKAIVSPMAMELSIYE